MVIYPVVPKDVILLRLIPTAVHTMEDVKYTIETFKVIQKGFHNRTHYKLFVVEH